MTKCIAFLIETNMQDSQLLAFKLRTTVCGSRDHGRVSSIGYYSTMNFRVNHL